MIAYYILVIMTFNILANRYAVIVGQNDGGKEMKSLRYAEDDASRFSKLLVEIGGFMPENVITLTDTDSSRVYSALKKTSEALWKNNQSNNSLFLFYYSGHADEDGLLLGKSRYSFEILQKTISNFSSAIRIGIFDACQSGVVTAFKGGKRADPFFLQNQQQIKGQVIIASSAANERAQESDALKGSVFSFHWLNGLRGSADQSADRKVTLNEAYQYAYRKTVETSALATGEIQHPVYRFSIQGQGDILLTNLENAAGGILVDNSCKGKFLVLSENYLDVFADFYKNSNEEYFISLAPGKYTIINALGQNVTTHQFSIDQNKRKKIRKSDFSSVALTKNRIKGYDPDNSGSMEKEMVPLSRFGWGISAGVMMDNMDGKKWSRDVMMGWSGFYQVNDFLDLNFDIYGLIDQKHAGALVGIDKVLRFEKGKINFGAGAGLEYSGAEKYNIERNVSPLLSARLSFSADINDRFQVQMVVPYTAIFNNSIVHRIGVGLRFVFSGRYKNVGVLE